MPLDTHLSYLVVGGEFHRVAEDAYGPVEFADLLNADWRLAPQWEAVGMVCVIEEYSANDELRLHIPAELPFDQKEELLADVEAFASSRFPDRVSSFMTSELMFDLRVIEIEQRAARSSFWTFARTSDIRWEACDTPVFRSVDASESLAGKVARRWVAYECCQADSCANVDCNCREDHVVEYPHFNDYRHQRYQIR